MDIKVVLSNKDTAYIIRNLFPLFLHDLSEFDGTLPNEHGILEPAPVQTLVEQGEIFKNRWETPNVFFPFLIFVDGRPAGFDLIATQPYAPSSIDYFVHDFFLLHRIRHLAGLAPGFSADQSALACVERLARLPDRSRFLGIIVRRSRHRSSVCRSSSSDRSCSQHCWKKRIAGGSFFL